MVKKMATEQQSLYLLSREMDMPDPGMSRLMEPIDDVLPPKEAWAEDAEEEEEEDEG